MTRTFCTSGENLIVSGNKTIQMKPARSPRPSPRSDFLWMSLVAVVAGAAGFLMGHCSPHTLLKPSLLSKYMRTSIIHSNFWLMLFVEAAPGVTEVGPSGEHDL